MKYEIVEVKRLNDDIPNFEHIHTSKFVNLPRKMIMDFHNKRTIKNYYNLYGQKDLEKEVIQQLKDIDYINKNLRYTLFRCSVELDTSVTVIDKLSNQVVCRLK